MTRAEEIEFETHLSAAEDAEARGLLIRSARERYRLLVPVAYVLWFGAAAAPSMLLWPSSREVLLHVLCRLVVFFGVLLLLPKVIRRRRPFVMWYATEELPHVETVASAHGVTVRWEGFLCVQSWHQFPRVYLTPRLILCCNRRMPCVIPRAGLAVEAVEQILAWINAAVPNRVRHLN